eukprot:m.108243 g.108243  ORF g.108243 m.108243 type:complete len:72 (+) comp27858_c0_seq1:274-489(+)
MLFHCYWRYFMTVCDAASCGDKIPIYTIIIFTSPSHSIYFSGAMLYDKALEVSIFKSLIAIVGFIHVMWKM